MMVFAKCHSVAGIIIMRDRKWDDMGSIGAQVTAICGALLGAVWGRDAIPAQWLDSLQNCRPEAKNPRVRHPRPECFWPVDVLELAELLISQNT
jgi:hypothetical protein